jgi:hypothetical protein
MDHHAIVPHPVAVVGDVVGGALAFGSYVGHLPDIAAAMSITWFVVRFLNWMWGVWTYYKNNKET